MIAYIQFETIDGAMISTTLERILFLKTVTWPHTKSVTAYVFMMGTEEEIEVDPLIGEKISQAMRSASSVECLITNSLDRAQLRRTADDRNTESR